MSKSLSSFLEKERTFSALNQSTFDEKVQKTSSLILFQGENFLGKQDTLLRKLTEREIEIKNLQQEIDKMRFEHKMANMIIESPEKYSNITQLRQKRLERSQIKSSSMSTSIINSTEESEALDSGLKGCSSFLLRTGVTNKENLLQAEGGPGEAEEAAEAEDMERNEKSVLNTMNVSNRKRSQDRIRRNNEYGRMDNGRENSSYNDLILEGQKGRSIEKCKMRPRQCVTAFQSPASTLSSHQTVNTLNEGEREFKCLSSKRKKRVISLAHLTSPQYPTNALYANSQNPSYLPNQYYSAGSSPSLRKTRDRQYQDHSTLKPNIRINLSQIQLK